MKTCSKCKTSLPESSFHKSKNSRSQCKRCAINTTNAHRYALGRVKRIARVDPYSAKKDSAKKAGRDMVKNLKPYYVAAKLGLKTKDMTSELFEMKVEQLLMQRTLRELNKILKEQNGN